MHHSPLHSTLHIIVICRYEKPMCFKCRPFSSSHSLLLIDVRESLAAVLGGVSTEVFLHLLQLVYVLLQGEGFAKTGGLRAAQRRHYRYRGEK